MNKLYELEMNSDFENVCITVVYFCFTKIFTGLKTLKCANIKCKELNVTDLCLWNVRCANLSLYHDFLSYLTTWLINLTSKTSETEYKHMK